MNDMSARTCWAGDQQGKPVAARFVTGWLAAGFALAVQPVCAQTMIRTDTTGLVDGVAG